MEKSEKAELAAYKKRLARVVMKSEAVKSLMEMCFTNLAGILPNEKVPPVICELFERVGEDVVENVLNNEFIKVDVNNPNFKEDIMDKAIHVADVGRILDESVPFPGHFEDLRVALHGKEGIQIPASEDHDARNLLAVFVVVATESAILAMQNISQGYITMTTDEAIVLKKKLVRHLAIFRAQQRDEATKAPDASIAPTLKSIVAGVYTALKNKKHPPS